MDEPRLQIERKKYTGESVVVSLRIPKDMVKTFDEVAQMTGRTRNELMSISLEFALNHMDILQSEER